MGHDNEKRRFIKNFFRFTALAACPFFLIRQKNSNKKDIENITYKYESGQITDEDYFIVDGWIVHINQVKSRLSGNI